VSIWNGVAIGGAVFIFGLSIFLAVARGVSNRARYTAKTALWLSVGLVVSLPFLSFIQGRIRAERFLLGLHRGMTLNQVYRLWDAAPGEGYPAPYGMNPNALQFSFVDWGYPCVEGGKKYIVYFDSAVHVPEYDEQAGNEVRVKSWAENDWETGC
jgi:hypothetical protein